MILHYFKGKEGCLKDLHRLGLQGSAGLQLEMYCSLPWKRRNRRNIKRQLAQSPNSYFMYAKCPAATRLRTARLTQWCWVWVFQLLCQPIGGKARLRRMFIQKKAILMIHSFLNLCPVTESLFSSVIQLIYQDNAIMFNFSHGLQQRSHILVSVLNRALIMGNKFKK